MKRGKLCGVSVGPGDPELITLKAVRVIREADVVAVPNTGQTRQVAVEIARDYLGGKRLLECQTPMREGHAAAEQAYRAIAEDICAILDEGKSVAYLVLGDATVYSTYMYVHELVCARGYEAEIVPGVTSFCAAAATLGVALCEGSEGLLVTPVLATEVDEVLDVPATKVFMKAGRSLGELRDKLEKRDMLDHACMVANCGMPDERVYPRFADAHEPYDYFSVVIAKEDTSYHGGKRDSELGV